MLPQAFNNLLTLLLREVPLQPFEGEVNDVAVIQFLRRNLPERKVDAGEMFTVERVEFGIVGGAVFRPIPPAPIAAFRRQQGFKGLLQSGVQGRIAASLGASVEMTDEAIPSTASSSRRAGPSFGASRSTMTCHAPEAARCGLRYRPCS